VFPSGSYDPPAYGEEGFGFRSLRQSSLQLIDQRIPLLHDLVLGTENLLTLAAMPPL